VYDCIAEQSGICLAAQLHVPVACMCVLIVASLAMEMLLTATFKFWLPAAFFIKWSSLDECTARFGHWASRQPCGRGGSSRVLVRDEKSYISACPGARPGKHNWKGYRFGKSMNVEDEGEYRENRLAIR